MKIQLLVAAVFCLTLVSSNALADSTLSFSGPAGEWISQGKSYTFTSADAAFAATLGGNFGQALQVNVTPKGSSTAWTLQLANSNKNQLTVGKYKNAVRYPFNDGVPGLSLTGESRGCSEVKGEFEILELVVAKRKVNSLSVTFSQSCDGAAPITGTLVFSSKVACEDLPENKDTRSGLKLLKSLEKQKAALLKQLERVEGNIGLVKEKLNCS